jgi:ABC-type glycerol-3-phosphate transport system substrate-binding protein
VTTFLLIMLGFMTVLAALGWISAWGREDQIKELQDRAARFEKEAGGHLRVVETLLHTTLEMESVHTQTVEMLLDEIPTAGSTQPV